MSNKKGSLVKLGGRIVTVGTQIEECLSSRGTSTDKVLAYLTSKDNDGTIERIAKLLQPVSEAGENSLTQRDSDLLEIVDEIDEALTRRGGAYLPDALAYLASEKGRDIIEEIVNVLVWDMGMGGENVVDTDARPIHLMDESGSFGLRNHTGMGKVKLEKRDGELYVDGRKFAMFDYGLGDSLLKRVAVEEKKGRHALDATLLDYLIKHPPLFPDWCPLHWQMFALATTFEHRDGPIAVACAVQHKRGHWKQGWAWLGGQSSTQASIEPVATAT